MAQQIRYKKGYKYQLVDVDYVVQLPFKSGTSASCPFVNLSPNGLLIIHTGYAWDGPSGPTVDTSSFMRGSLVHDALYQLIRCGELSDKFRRNADEALRRHCLEDGMSRLRVWWVYRAVRMAGEQAACGPRPVMIAP